MVRSMLCKVPFFWSILINPAFSNLFMSAMAPPSIPQMGLWFTVILGVLCQGVAVGEFSLIDQDTTDRNGPA